MKTKNMIYFGILVAVLVITDCIAGKEPVIVNDVNSFCLTLGKRA